MSRARDASLTLPWSLPVAPDDPSYRIDYDDLDVVDLVSQIRARVERSSTELATLPATAGVDAGRLWDHLVVPDAGLEGLRSSLDPPRDWNVGPEDLDTSHDGARGTLIRAVRRLARPLLKLVANAELPLYKQHKINLGFAAALRQLMEENARLRAALAERALDDAASEASADSRDGRAD